MKKNLLTLLCVIISPYFLFAQTEISGTISNNTTLTSTNSPYIVTDNITINSGITLTVETGVNLKFNSGKYIQVYGTLTANSATFTANESTTDGFWTGIYVGYEWNSDIGQVTLNNCSVEYAKSLYVRKGQLTLTNNTSINNFSNSGVDIYTDGTLLIDHTSIQNCSYPVYFRGNGTWSAGEGLVLTGNDNDYIFLHFRDINSILNCPEAGIPYYYDSELRITETGSLLISAGVSFLGNTNAWISVNGKLKANGTPSQPVVFSNIPSSDYWQGINFNDNAIDTACILTNCKFTGANYSNYNNRNSEISRCAVEIMKSSPTFDNCEFSNNRYNLVVTGQSFPDFSNCDFAASNLIENQTLNINVDMNAAPVFSTCSIDFNTKEARAIGIIGSTVYDDSHLKQLSFTDYDNLTYSLYGNVTIQDTASLIIDPGIVIKCTNKDYYIQANGALTAIGEENNPIVFTHINDDNYGNPADTYNNGTGSINRSTSGRLILNSSTTSHIEYWKILYAGKDQYNYALTVHNNNIVKNCEIKESYRGILFSGNAQMVNNSIENISTYPLGRSMNEGSPVLIGNTVSNIGNIGIYIHSFTAGNYSVGGLDFAGYPNVAYIIDNEREIPTSADVTLQPGTVFKFKEYYGKLTVRGGLKAEGSKNNKIIFTSLYDNSVSGNTNFNGGDDPTGHKWGHIKFTETSNDGFNSLKNAEIRYFRNSLGFENCNAVMDSVTLNFSDSYGMSILGNATLNISNCDFNNLKNAPIQMDMFANATFSGNSVANVPRFGISLKGGTVSGTVPVRSFAGFDTITYLIDENIRVDGELTIPAGLVFKGDGGEYIDVYGKLTVHGTESKPVVFTTVQDDEYGNPKDTDQNGSGTVTKKNGCHIVFRDQADDQSVVDYTLFRYMYNHGIYMASASPTISNCIFYYPANEGIRLNGISSPTIHNCTFENAPFPLTISLMSFPGSTQNNVLSGTTGKGIHVIDNETLTQNTTLSQKNFAGIENIPYIFDRYTIGTSAVLTIGPGVICKFKKDGYINVRNGLMADGGSTPDSTIVFTSDRDDFYGGDTYDDGDANQPNDHWWWGIKFQGESIDASCFLDNCVFKNGTRNYSNSTNANNRGAITLDNSSPTIQNCLFEHNYWGLLVRNTSVPNLSNCDFVAVDPTHGYGIWNETGTVTISAENCWWNHDTGPYHATLNPDGQGERISDGVDFSPWISGPSQPVMGDVSLNGEVMPYDASLVLQSSVGTITLDSKQQAVADVSRDGTISSYDASLILQYSIGLIGSFELANPKSGSLLNDVTISVPDETISPETSRFEIPMAISTSSQIKAMDLKFVTDQQHLKFIGLNTEKLPSDILVLSGFNDDTGVLKIAIASAYDLDFNQNELGLIFEITNSQMEESKITLENLSANEKQENASLFTITVNSENTVTGFPDAAALSSLKIYSMDNNFIADLNLLTNQSQLIIAVYDISGKMTNRLIIENPGSGRHHLSFPAEGNGRKNPSKIYLISIRGDDFIVTRKLVLR